MRVFQQFSYLTLLFRLLAMTGGAFSLRTWLAAGLVCGARTPPSHKPSTSLPTHSVFRGLIMNLLFIYLVVFCLACYACPYRTPSLLSSTYRSVPCLSCRPASLFAHILCTVHLGGPVLL